MIMSLETFATRKNNTSINKEASVTPSGEQYSFQSEILDAKQNARSKYQQKKRSAKTEKSKNLRKGGNANHIPKNPPTPKKGAIQSTNDSCDFVHQSLLEHIYPSSILDQAKSKMLSLNIDANASSVFEVLEVVGALAISLPMCQTPVQVASQILLSIRALTKGSIIDQVLRQTDTIDWCKQTFGFNMFEPQSGEEVEKASWLSALPTLRENWDSVRNAPIFSKISAMITVATSIGLCSVANLKWSIAGVDLFRHGAVSKHSTDRKSVV